MDVVATTLLLLLLSTPLAVSGAEDDEGPCTTPCICRTTMSTYLGEAYIVFCKNSRLTALPDLTPFSQLEEDFLLDLEHNNIQLVRKSDFPAGLRLKVIVLKRNYGIRLEDSAFVNIAPVLHTLDLSYNGLQFDSPHTYLKGLYNIQKLILGSNSQSSGRVSGGFLNEGAPSLKFLELDNCSIQSIDGDAFRGVEELKTLDLSNNSLTSLPRAIKNLTNIQELKFAHNRIANLRKDDLSGLAKLSVLNVDGNANLTIQPDAFNDVSTTIKFISARSCNLVDLPPGFDSLSQLKYLDLAHNPLTELSSLDGTYCLDLIDLGYSQIPLSSSIFQVQQDCLKRVILDSVGVSSIPTDVIRPLKLLNHISLIDNKIEVITASAFEQIAITTLILKGNPLREIRTGAFANFGAGVLLDLDGTQMTHLSFVLEYPKDKFKRISLQNLELPCDCPMYEVLSWSTSTSFQGNCYNGTTANALNLPETMRRLRDNCTDEDLTTTLEPTTTMEEVDETATAIEEVDETTMTTEEVDETTTTTEKVDETTTTTEEVDETTATTEKVDETTTTTEEVDKFTTAYTTTAAAPTNKPPDTSESSDDTGAIVAVVVVLLLLLGGGAGFYFGYLRRTKNEKVNKVMDRVLPKKKQEKTTVEGQANVAFSNPTATELDETKV